MSNIFYIFKENLANNEIKPLHLCFNATASALPKSPKLSILAKGWWSDFCFHSVIAHPVVHI